MKGPKYPDDFTDEEISMVLSALAVGEPICCGLGLQARETITSNPAKQLALHNHAYEQWSCWVSDDAEFAERMLSYNLEKAERDLK